MISVNEMAQKANYSFADLVDIMKMLRNKNGGCPWDIEQTHKTIRNNFIEEAYEAIEGIDTENDTLLCEELGDVLLQIVFHSEIASSEGSFSIEDVTDGICKKLVLRHPHVFGKTVVSSSDEVLENWDAIKRKEKAQKTLYKAVDDVARTMPSLMRVQKIRKKCEKNGAQPATINGSAALIEAQLENICKNGTSQEAVANLLMAVSDIARIGKIDAEQALYNKCEDLIEAQKSNC